MPKIKWKSNIDIKSEKVDKTDKDKFKDKKFAMLTSKEKDQLIEIMAKQLGLIAE